MGMRSRRVQFYRTTILEPWRGLVPAVRVLWPKARRTNADSRQKRQHDGGGVIPTHHRSPLSRSNWSTPLFRPYSAAKATARTLALTARTIRRMFRLLVMGALSSLQIGQQAAACDHT